MIIQTTKTFNFQLLQLINPTNLVDGVVNAVVLAGCIVTPGSHQTVPDWVSFNPLFLTAVSDGSATVITAPTGAVALNAGGTSVNVELPSGQTVCITNADVNMPAWVRLGDDTVTVDIPVYPNPSNGVYIRQSSSVVLPLNGSTYLAAIGVSATNALNVAVI